MKIVSKEAGTLLVRFDRGEEVVRGLALLAQTEQWRGAAFTAIGAAEEFVISFYNGKTKAYEDMRIKEDVEIVSLSGNIAWKDAEPVVHAHGVFADRSMKTFGGHVKKCVISFSGEVALSLFSEKANRTHDTATGLNLLE